MEEADMLCDRIAIMAEGRLAAEGTPMDLKQRFGVGYRLTVVKQERGEVAASGDPADQERYVYLPSTDHAWYCNKMLKGK